MTEITKDSENVEISPFQEEIVLENYFPCGSRAEVLSDMKEAVENGVTLMVLTGEDGTGKTMLCRVLKHEAPCQTVFFPRTVDSFEEVVRNIALCLGLQREIDSSSLDESLQQIVDCLLDRSADLLVIFDDAENIFLATLERIRKMLDRINGAGAQMHILLCGQETLLENCDQVSLCNFQNSDECHFELSPLSEAETAAYLQYCASRLPSKDAAGLFTDEVINSIFSVAQGNFRMTNILGQETVTSRNDENSFVENMESDEEGVEVETAPSYAIKYPRLEGKITRYLPWIGGAVCCLLLLFMLFRSGKDDIEVGKDMNQTQRAEQIETMPTTPKTDENLFETKELATLSPVEELQPPEEETEVSGAEEKAPGQEVGALSPSVEKSSQPVIDQEQDVASSQPVIDQEQGVAEDIVPEASQTAETVATADSGDVEPVAESEEKEVDEVVAAAEEKLSQEAAPAPAKDVALLRPGKQVKRKMEASSAQPLRSNASHPPANAVPKVTASAPHFAADKLYNARLSAGSGWTSLEKKKMFTVQLMALTSKNAEQNLKKILTQVNYRQEAGKFYILQKKTAPEGVFVFYGEYLSSDKARLAQDSLPQFLRDHKPYVLSIGKAIAKVGK